jgi:hypothetical protein
MAVARTIQSVTERLASPADLTRLLERLSVERGRSVTPAASAEAQVGLLLARIGLLTDALRDAPDNDTATLAARLALSDLARIAAQFRARTNGIGASLDTVREQLREALAASDAAPEPPA